MKTHALCSLPPFGMALSVCLCISGCGVAQDAQFISDASKHETLEVSNSLALDAPSTSLLARTGLSREDHVYLLALAASHSYQGQMGNLVVTQTHHPDTREFGRFLVETYQDVRRRLDLIALRYNIALPSRLNGKQSYRLHKLSCCVWFFEKSFFKYEYKELEKLGAQSRRALARSANPEVQAWARDTLATIDLTIRMSAAGNAVFEGRAFDSRYAEPLPDDSDDDAPGAQADDAEPLAEVRVED